MEVDKNARGIGTGVTVQPYTDSKADYDQRLPGELEKAREFGHRRLTYAEQVWTPFGTSYMSGLPLFKPGAPEKDYLKMIDLLRDLAPHQYWYDAGETHNAHVVVKRNAPRDGSSLWVPPPDRQAFYGEELEILEGVDFEPFNLRVKEIFHIGMMVLEPEDDTVFEVRRQLAEGIGQKLTPDRYDHNGGKLSINPLLNVTFMRPYDLGNLEQNDEKLREAVASLNENIRGGTLFADPITIDSVLFNEVQVIPAPTRTEYFYDTIIERKFARGGDA